MVRFISLKRFNYFLFTDLLQCICRSWCHLDLCTNLLFSLVRLLIINRLKQILNKLLATTASTKNKEKKRARRILSKKKKKTFTVLVFLLNTACSSSIQIFKLCQQLDKPIELKIFQLVLKVWIIFSGEHLFFWIWCIFFWSMQEEWFKSCLLCLSTGELKRPHFSLIFVTTAVPLVHNFFPKDLLAEVKTENPFSMLISLPAH